MKAIKCELCGSNEFLKQDGFFTCQSCGTKYTLEEAKKMMIEGTVQVSGTVKVDNSNQVESYLKMARTANESNNIKDAEDYSNKVIEIDPNNSEAWLIKGQAAAWGRRFREAIECWKHSIDNVDNSKKEDYQKIMSEDMVSALMAEAEYRASIFGSYPSEQDAENLRDMANADGILYEMEEKLDLDMSSYEDILFDTIANDINIGIASGWKTANELRGSNKEERNRYAYDAWLPLACLCADMAPTAIDCSRTEKTLETSFNNFTYTTNEILKSESYKLTFVLSIPTYVTDTKLNDVGRAKREKLLKDITEIVEKRKKEIKEQSEKKLREKQEAERQEREAEQKKKEEKINAYWADHLDEKKALEDEKNELEEKIKELKQQRNNLDNIDELRKERDKKLQSEIECEKQQNYIEELENQRLKCNVFQGKQKQQLSEQIEIEKNKLENNKQNAEKEKALHQKDINERIELLKKNSKSLEKEIQSLNNKRNEINCKLNLEEYDKSDFDEPKDIVICPRCGKEQKKNPYGCVFCHEKM